MRDPNILLILSDQHRADCLGVNGHPFLQTPHLDQLAAEGVNFTQAYCPTPICTPSRLSLLHGQYPTRHMAIANSDSEAPRPPRAGLPTFSEALRDAGYFMGYVGKWHAYPDLSPLDFGFDRYHHYDEYLAWREARGIPLLDEQNWYFGELDPHIRAEDSRLAWGAEKTLELVTECVRKGQKFFIRYDPTEPHLPNQVPEPYFSQLYPPETIPPWTSFPDPLVNKPYIQGQMRRTWKVDHWTWEDWSPMVSRYLGEISLMDEQIGRILAGLDALGAGDNTLVVYSSDHGDLVGAHGMIDKHYVMYDDVVRVPLIMRWRRVIPPGTMCDAFISHSVDLAVTFCAAANVPVPSTFQGMNLLPLMQGGNFEQGREDIFAMYFGNQFGLYSQRMVRDRRWKYIWNATAQDELYDLNHDPGELHNLASRAEHRDTLTRLRHRLVDWMRTTDDPLLNMWTERQLLEGLKV